jgi:hypothetical protein
LNRQIGQMNSGFKLISINAHNARSILPNN